MLKETPITELKMNPMSLIGDRWMLVTAGNKENGYNTMTAAWGHIGAIWGMPGRAIGRGMPTAVVYLRPQRYTKEFMEREELFTLSFFDEKYRKALLYLGTHSGRDGDKIAAAKLTPLFIDDTTCFDEADMVFICKKLYHSALVESGFLEKDIVKNNYPKKDFHDFYIGEIIKALCKN